MENRNSMSGTRLMQTAIFNTHSLKSPERLSDPRQS